MAQHAWHALQPKLLLMSIVSSKRRARFRMGCGELRVLGRGKRREEKVQSGQTSSLLRMECRVHNTPIEVHKFMDGVSTVQRHRKPFDGKWKKGIAKIAGRDPAADYNPRNNKQTADIGGIIIQSREPTSRRDWLIHAAKCSLRDVCKTQKNNPGTAVVHPAASKAKVTDIIVPQKGV